jgi:hypothetical protein
MDVGNESILTIDGTQEQVGLGLMESDSARQLMLPWTQFLTFGSAPRVLEALGL